MSSTGRTGHKPTESALELSVREYLTRYEVPRSRRILVALSGGPDSVALTDVLWRMGGTCEWSLCCAYLDHGIRSREEREQDLLFVKEFTSARKITLFYEELETGLIEKIVREQGSSTEDVARNLRYDFLSDAVRKAEADFLAMGHTMDDQLETLVMRFFQGSGTAGLSGIPERRENIIRPLISCSRIQVMEYLSERNLGYRVDRSNLEPLYLRNRVRLELLPRIAEVFPGFRSALLNGREKMELADDFLSGESSRRLKWQPHGAAYRIEKDVFCTAPPVLRMRSVFSVYNVMKLGGRLPYRFLKPVLELPAQMQDRILLRGYGFLLRIAGNTVFAERDIVQLTKTGYDIEIKKNREYTIHGLVRVRTESCTSGSYGGNDPWVSLDCIHPPLTLRSRRSGDVISYKGGRKSLKKLFSEWKVPLEQRPLIPVLEDQEGILGVFGGPFGFKNRFSERCTGERFSDTQILIFSFVLNGD